MEINGEALKFHVPSGQRKFASGKGQSKPRSGTTTASTPVTVAPTKAETTDLEPQNTDNQGEPTPNIGRSIVFRDGRCINAIAIPDDDEDQIALGLTPLPVTMTFTSVVELERQILATDGRAPPGAKNDPWRHIRLLRRNQDLGALWDLREQEYNRSQRRV